MENLNELVGQTVTATMPHSTKDEEIYIRCKITSVNIEDFYFEEKGEKIYISVCVDPIDELPEDVDYEQLNDIDLSNIYR